MNMLPNKKFYEYLSYLFKSTQLIPITEWRSDNFDYTPLDINKFQKVILENKEFIKDKKVLDLGCHAGFMIYISLLLGAKSGTGLNARAWPIEIANYFFDQIEYFDKQIKIADHEFLIGDIENFDLLTELCNQSDTVILSTTLEHMRNPELIIRTISESTVQNIIIESTVVDDNNLTPNLYYYLQETSDANCIDKDKKISLGSCPNSKWLESILFYHSWKIVKYEKYDEFDPNCFANKNARQTLQNYPILRKVVTITATKFE